MPTVKTASRYVSTNLVIYTYIHTYIIMKIMCSHMSHIHDIYLSYLHTHSMTYTCYMKLLKRDGKFISHDVWSQISTTVIETEVSTSKVLIIEKSKYWRGKIQIEKTVSPMKVTFLKALLGSNLCVWLQIIFFGFFFKKKKVVNLYYYNNFFGVPKN